TLSPQKHPLHTYLDGNLIDMLETTYRFEEILKQELFWCLLCMRFQSSSESVDYIKLLFERIPHHKTLVDCIKIKSVEWLQNNTPENWQLQIAMNKTNLYLYSSFSVALKTFINNLVRKPIA
ncbi:3896_t:CDS:2, partial [Gigaspora margarita]